MTSCHMQRSITIFGLATSHLDLVSKSKWKTTQAYIIPRWSFMLASSSTKNRHNNRLIKSNKTLTTWKMYLQLWLTTMPSLVLNFSMLLKTMHSDLQHPLIQANKIIRRIFMSWSSHKVISSLKIRCLRATLLHRMRRLCSVQFTIIRMPAHSWS
jgi:hypothetical protein